MKARQVAGTLAGADDFEATGTGPVDVLTDEGGLIAPGKAVDHPGLGRTPGKKRSRQSVGLHIHHHYMTPGLERGQGVSDAGSRGAGRLDENVEIRGLDQSLGIVGQPGATSAKS